jgi:hypothetical protein
MAPHPARKWRAVGRIEHPLLDGGRSSTPSDLRPSPAVPIIPQKVTVVAKRARAEDGCLGVSDVRGPEPTS